MKTIKQVLLSGTLVIALLSCGTISSQQKEIVQVNQSDVTNKTIAQYNFLDCMCQDPYFPEFMVDKCKQVLISLCLEIESTNPKELEDLYILSHKATDGINALQDEFGANNSEIETGARECLAINFEYIAKAYGFDADIEELIATRDW